MDKVWLKSEMGHVQTTKILHHLIWNDPKREMVNYKLANWEGLNEALVNALWDVAFVADDVDASLSN